MNEFLIYAGIGFLAQTIDGALGMAYGISATTCLLSAGVGPAMASASVKSAEIFTTFVSALSHWKLKNIDRQLFLRLLIPGILGGVAGACLVSLVHTKVMVPAVSIYLLGMGVVIIVKAVRRPHHHQPAGKKTAAALGLSGGFCDAVGGGGWGPIVTSSLMAKGHEPRYTIGTVNTAEFFVTLAQLTAFVTLLHGFSDYWKVILGLAVGGVVAAPMAAKMTRHSHPRLLLILVGVLVIVINLVRLATLWLNR